MDAGLHPDCEARIGSPISPSDHEVTPLHRYRPVIMLPLAAVRVAPGHDSLGSSNGRCGWACIVVPSTVVVYSGQWFLSGSAWKDGRTSQGKPESQTALLSSIIHATVWLHWNHHALHTGFRQPIRQFPQRSLVWPHVLMCSCPEPAGQFR